jgi:small subunit ribosomal protein S20
MPIKQNAKKYMRITAKNTVLNKESMGIVKAAVRATREALAAKDVTKAEEGYKKAQKAMDKAAIKGMMKKNTVSRRKSRLQTAIKKLKGIEPKAK